MNAVKLFLLVQKLKPLHVPGDVASVRHDLEFLHRSNEALLLLLEISLVGKRQRRFGLLEDIEREPRRRFAFGMEMPLQWDRRLSSCRALIQDQMTRDGEGGSHRRKGLHELSSGGHRFVLILKRLIYHRAPLQRLPLPDKAHEVSGHAHRPAFLHRPSLNSRRFLRRRMHRGILYTGSIESDKVMQPGGLHWQPRAFRFRRCRRSVGQALAVENQNR